MVLTYAQLAEKARLLARPRIRVSNTSQSLRIELLAIDNPDLVLLTHDFIYKTTKENVNSGKIIGVISAYLETVAIMLENLPQPFSATSFSQDLYNAGFWVNQAGGCSIFHCELISLVYEPHLWIGKSSTE
jgi:hypothetical protein